MGPMAWWLIAAAWGGSPLDRTLDSSADSLEIVVDCGQVKVVGSARTDVRILGSVDEANGLTIDHDEDEVEISSRPGRGACAQLVVEVPSTATLELVGRDTAVSVEGLTGGIEILSQSGEVVVRGLAASVEVETVSGAIRVTGARQIELATVSGRIAVVDPADDVAATTVSGAITLIGQGLDDVELEAVSGSIDVTGSLGATGHLEAQTHNGPLKLRLPADLDARLEVETFTGKVLNAFGAGEALTLGGGSARMELASFAGDITLERTPAQ